MNSTAPVLEKVEDNPEDLPIDRPRKSGFIVRRGDRQAAMDLLDSLLIEGDPDEQRGTLEFLEKALNERRTAGYLAELIIRKINPDAAHTLLAELDKCEPSEQPKALECLKHSLNDEHSARKAEGTMNSPNTLATIGEYRKGELPIDRPRKSGFVIKPINVEKAISTLRSFYEEDEEEQRETFEYLKRALNEGRAERGERLIYIEDE